MTKILTQNFLFKAFIIVAAILISGIFLQVLAVDGSGTNTVSPTSTTAGSTAGTYTFTYTAAEAMNSGSVTVSVPSGWSAPQGTVGTAGYTTVSSTGTVGSVLDSADSVTNWSAGSACTTGAPTVETTIKQEGTGSIRCINGNEGSGDVFYKNITAENWSGYTKVGVWVRATSNVNTNNLRFAYDDSTNLASPLETIVLPTALVANTWQYLVFNFGATTRTSIQSFGFQITSATGLDNVTLYTDFFLIGPGIPVFSGTGPWTITTRFVEIANGNTVTLTYGSGGGTSGVTAPSVAGVNTFTTQSRTAVTGTLTNIGTSPTITVNNPVPSTSSISPTSKNVNDAEFTLTVNGSNFVSGSIVQFAGSNRTTTFINSGQVTAIIPSTDLTSQGNFNITVFNPTPGGGTSNAQIFTVTAPDVTAPAAVSDLALSSPTTSSLTVSWTAPGDDNNTGTATTYDLRYSTSLISEGNFASATAVTGEPSPSIAGSSESMVVSGLNASTLYYFALKTSDEVPNISIISNVPSLSTSAVPDLTAPTVTAFSIPSTATSLTVSITTFTATDNISVTGYLLTESASAPLASNPNWTGTAPTSYVFASEGSKTLYAWAKDASNNISSSLNDSVTITLPQITEISDGEIQNTISGGIIVPNNILTSSSQITFTEEVKINFITGSQMIVPVNSVMSAGTNVDFSQLAATSTVPTATLTADAINYSFGGAVSFGLPSNTLTSNELITIKIFAGSSYNTQTLPVFKKPAGSSIWSKFTTCVISSGLCQFTTNSFSSFVVGTPIVTTGGGSIPTIVVFSGKAYPNGKIRVYRRSLIENVVRNDYLPNFDISVNDKGDFAKSFIGLFEYDYLFTLEPFDKNGVSGGIIAFNKAISSFDRLMIEDIFMPPTVVIQNKSVTKGNEIKISGYAYPGSNVELKIDNVLRINSTANNLGYYEAAIDTSRFSPKTHFVVVRQIDKEGRASDFSASKNFLVSALSYPQADFNGDNVIDIKDWSIFLFRWKANATLRAFNDLNTDGKVDILDLSIFLKAIRGL